MLTLPGPAALSDFRVRKLIEDSGGAIKRLQSQYIHFVDVETELDERSLGILSELLRYGSAARQRDQVARAGRGDLFRLVIPRRGTLSPWSSKATDIAHTCGLQAVRRIERGVAYLLQASGPDPGPLLHDRMVEEVVCSLDVSFLFDVAEPARLARVSVLEQGAPALVAANRALGMALTGDEIEYLVDAFRDLGRDPTDVELMMFAQANSEHCRHKTFHAGWEVDGVTRDTSLMDMIRNTHRMTNGAGVLSAYEDNASVIEGHRAGRFFPDPETREFVYHEEEVHILMKVETHNHPTAIAPFPGAATGSGGEIRDEGAVGRGSKPKAGLTGYTVSDLCLPGFPRPWEKVYGKPDSIACALDIMVEAPVGGASFNNEFGRPNISGYFRTFEMEVAGAMRGYHKPIMIAGGLGNIRAGHVRQTPINAGARLIVLGGPAMLIGLGGGAASSMATGSSDACLDFASVQRANAEMEHRCQEVIDRCWQMGDGNPVRFIHDVGAGGLSNALPELVRDGGVGGDFDLRSLPSAEPGMSPLEIWCNEAQERYVLAVDGTDMALFEAICARERCPFAVVGVAVADSHLRLRDSLYADVPVDLPMSLLFGGPPKLHKRVRSQRIQGSRFVPERNLDDCIDRVLSHPAVASSNFLVTIGDRSVGGLVCRDQLVGPWQVPVADVAVTSSSYAGYTGEAMAMGERTPVALLSAAAAARLAVAEAITNLVAADVRRLGDIRLSANWMAASGRPGEDASLYEAVNAVGMELCPALGITVPVGKDSMSMSTEWREGGADKSVISPLSLIISAFAPVADVGRTLTPLLETDENPELLFVDLARGKERLGGSILLQCFSELGDESADLDDPGLLKRFFDVMTDARDEILAYHDRSDGGLLATLSEMAFTSRCGLEILVPEDRELLPFLFNEEPGAVLQVRRRAADTLVRLFASRGIPVSVVARINGTDEVTLLRAGQRLTSRKRRSLQSIWSRVSFEIQKLRDNPVCAREEFEALQDEEDPGLGSRLTFDMAEDIAAPMIARGARPAVAILREQGVNGQVEMAAAFDRAGFAAVDLHMTELFDGASGLGSFKGLVACGGFSYGDVLGAGEGWAKSILYHEDVRSAFADFFARGDTFALGVCNGCQMLAALKEIIPGAGSWPKFVRNRSEQFEARFSLVRVEETHSLFFADMAGSHIPVVVSHGEGRADIGPAALAELEAASQVTLRFIDHRLRVTQRYPLNPNGSPGGVTGICNENGRVLAMMPHPERVFRTVQNSWHPAGWGEDSPWMRMFRNARVWVG